MHFQEDLTTETEISILLNKFKNFGKPLSEICGIIANEALKKDTTREAVSIAFDATVSMRLMDEYLTSCQEGKSFNRKEFSANLIKDMNEALKVM